MTQHHPIKHYPACTGQKMFMILLLLMSGMQHLLSQNQHIVDSLQQVIVGNAPDSIRVDAYLAMAGEYLDQSPQQAIRYAEQANDLAVRIQATRGIMISLGWLAYLHEQVGDIRKALNYNAEALEVAQRIGDKRKQAILLNNIAAIYKDRGELDTALNLNLKSLALREVIKDTNGIATTYNNLGLIYQGQGRIEDAIEDFSKALQGFELIQDSVGMATSLQNIGAIYKEQKEFDAALQYNRRSLSISTLHGDNYSAGFALNSLGNIYEANQNPDSALYYYNQALQLRKIIDDQQGVAYTLKNIGNIQDRLQHDVEAESAFKESLSLFVMLDDKWGEAKVTNSYGSLLLRQDKLVQAEKYLERSFRLAHELGYPADISAAAYALQQLYRQEGDWRRATTLLDEYLIMHDSIQNDINRKAAIKTQYRYEYEKKEVVLKSEQEKRNALAAAELAHTKLLRNVFIYGFAGVLVFAIIVLLQRNRIAKEKQRSETLLLNILPREIAEELKEKGKSEARQFDSVSVLCTDFKDFTIHSEQKSPKVLISELNDCFKAFDEIVTRLKLEKIKTVGDAYIAVAGLPVPNPDHALLAVRAAIEIRDFMNHRWNEIQFDTFQMRCGIHSGTVVAGIVGVKKYAYDIWGDTVNTATRMEQNCEVGKINISETTYQLVKDHYSCEYRGKMEAKNKGRIEMYYVDGVHLSETL